MPTYFHRPENALNRAKEFIDVDKKESAVEVLSDIIRSKKHRQWSETHEAIMGVYLKLCTDLQRSLAAKDGLYQYRNICKDTNLNSFKCVIEAFLDLAEQKASSAREESAQTVLDIEDLDAIQTPESILLSTVSGEDTQDRTDRIMLMPWVKFLWESFRNVLELLKNNKQLENIYVTVAKRAFAFCLEYKRRTEFHKLCDIMRNHLTQVENSERQPQEKQSSQYSMKLDNSDTIQCLVDTRFEQLDKAIAIDLWQEAFKAIESINFLISRPKQKAKASLLENFYQKQASVYWMANNKLFHAAALHRLFVLRKEQKKSFSLGSEEAQKTATHVVLATLAVPVVPILSTMEKLLIDDNTRHEKGQKLAALLRIQTPPTRASLLSDLVNLGVFQCVSQELLQLYLYLESDYNPLTLCQKVKPLLDALLANEDTAMYVEALKNVTLVRFVKQISQVYHSIPLSRLAELSLFATPMELERIVVETAKTNDIEVKIDHKSESLWFGKDISLVHHDKIPEGPVIQSMPSEVFGSHLTLMAQALHQAAKIILSHDQEVEHKSRQQSILKKFQENEQQERWLVLKRRQAIEDRKIYLETQLDNKKRELEDERIRKERELREEKNSELKDIREKENQEKKKKNIEEMKRKIAEDKLEQLKKTPIGARAFADVTASDLQDLDVDEIMLKQLQQMDKEKRDRNTKLKGQEKKIDYFERAKRIVELPLLEKQYTEQIEKDKQFHEETETERVNKEITDHNQYVDTKARLDKMAADKVVFLKVIEDRRKLELSKEMKVFEEELAKQREARLAKRCEERKQKRKLEAETLLKEEEERQIQEKEEEEKRKKEEERREHAEKMEQQRLKQQARDKEIEEKMRRKEDEQRRKEDEQRQRDDSWRRTTDESPNVSRRREGDDRRYSSRRDDGDNWRGNASPPRGNWRDGGGTNRRNDDSNWRRDDRRDFDRFKESERSRDRFPERLQRDRQDRYRDSERLRDSDRYSERSRNSDRYSERSRDSDRYSERSRDSDRFERSRDSDRFPERSRESGRYSERSRDSDWYSERSRDSDRFERSRDSDRFDRSRDSDRFERSRDSDRFDRSRDSERSRDSDRWERSRDSERSEESRDLDSLGSRSLRDQTNRRVSPSRSDDRSGSWRSEEPKKEAPPTAEDGWKTVNTRRR